MYTKTAITGMSREEWLNLRKTGIGGSDAGAVCGLNPYSNAMKVYHDKVRDDISNEDHEAMRVGRDLEEYVANRFMEETGWKVRRSNYLYRSVEHPFMIADVDRLIVGQDAGLECKTASAYNADKWKDGEIPLHYLLQCQHYMTVTGKKEWYIAVLIMGVGFQYRRIERDEELIEKMVQMESEFWHAYVIPKIMPEPDGSKVCDEILEQYFKVSKKNAAIVLTDGFDSRLQRRNELNGLIKKMQTEKSQIEQEIKAFMGEHELAYNDHYRVSWGSVESSRVDMNLLKEKEPEVYKRYLKPSVTRRFSVKAA